MNAGVGTIVTGVMAIIGIGIILNYLSTELMAGGTCAGGPPRGGSIATEPRTGTGAGTGTPVIGLSCVEGTDGAVARTEDVIALASEPKVFGEYGPFNQARPFTVLAGIAAIAGFIYFMYKKYGGGMGATA